MENNVLLCFETGKGKQLMEAVSSCMEDNGMWEKIKGGALLGFSGGADSVFLTLALLYLREVKGSFPIQLCHIHHGIRREGADRDLAFSVAFAEEYGLDITVVCYDVPSLAREQGLGLEECARNIRYLEFEKIKQGRDDISCILTAHNATDNVETVIQRLMRGTGIRGLCGISAVRDEHILRPILYISKRDIVEFLDDNNIPYVIDETNSDLNYTRNFIRNEILPDLARITPSPEVSIARFVQNLREDDLCLTDIANDFLNSQNLPFVSIEDFLKTARAVQYRILYAMAKNANREFMLQRMHVDLILSSISTGKRQKISLSHNFYFIAEKGKMYFESQSDDAPYPLPLCMNTPVESSCFGATFLLCDEDGFQTYKNVYKNSISVSLSSAIIQGELYVRCKNANDSYRVRKMTRKLKTLIQSLHLPTAQSRRIPVICDEKGILYVPPFGVREDENGSYPNDKQLYILLIYGDGTRMPWQD